MRFPTPGVHLVVGTDAAVVSPRDSGLPVQAMAWLSSAGGWSVRVQPLQVGDPGRRWAALRAEMDAAVHAVEAHNWRDGLLVLTDCEPVAALMTVMTSTPPAHVRWPEWARDHVSARRLGEHLFEQVQWGLLVQVVWAGREHPMVQGAHQLAAAGRELAVQREQAQNMTRAERNEVFAEIAGDALRVSWGG